MNNYQLCSHRDKHVIRFLSILKAATTDQISVCLFPSKAGYRKCCDRLKYLRERDLIKCIERPFFNMPNVYYLSEKPALSHLEHIIAVSWIYVWLSMRFEIEYWEQEVDFGTLQCDALCKVKGGMWYFIEFDRVGSHNKFKKPIQYTELHEKEGKPGSNLLKRLDNPLRFPRIIIVTDSAKRGVRIQDAIKANNPHGLGYGINKDKKDEIYLYGEILKEVKR